MSRSLEIIATLFSACQEMFAVNAYPKGQSPDFVKPDLTMEEFPRDEHLEQKDLVWGRDSLKKASALQECKEAYHYLKGAHCPDFVATHGHHPVTDVTYFQHEVHQIYCMQVTNRDEMHKNDEITWYEHLQYKDNLVARGQHSIKGWRKTTSAPQELQHTQQRALFQQEFAGICEVMCREANHYPKCAQCPALVEPDSTLLSWDESLQHTDCEMCYQVTAYPKCRNIKMHQWRRMQAKNHEEVRKNKTVIAYTKCAQCPDELLEHMANLVNKITWYKHLYKDNLVAWGQHSIKGWRKKTSAPQESKHTSVQSQSESAGICEELCKEVEVYPKCNYCPNFVKPDGMLEVAKSHCEKYTTLN